MVVLRELFSDGFLAVGDRPGALVALVGDDLIDVDVLVDVVVVPGTVVVWWSRPGGRRSTLRCRRCRRRRGDVVVVAGGVVLAGEQLGVVPVGPALSVSLGVAARVGLKP